jgi:hypothetical protein
MRQYEVDAVPFQHPQINQWRENFKGVQVQHAPTNLTVTSAVATDTIDYVAADQNGLTSTTTRTVIIEASPSIVPTNDASTTAATSTAQ